MLSFPCTNSTLGRRYDYSCPYKTYEPRCTTAENNIFIIDPNCTVTDFDNYKTICECIIDNNSLTRRLSDGYSYNTQIGSINQVNFFSSSFSLVDAPTLNPSPSPTNLPLLDIIPVSTSTNDIIYIVTLSIAAIMFIIFYCICYPRRTTNEFLHGNKPGFCLSLYHFITCEKSKNDSNVIVIKNRKVIVAKPETNIKDLLSPK